MFNLKVALFGLSSWNRREGNCFQETEHGGRIESNDEKYEVRHIANYCGARPTIWEIQMNTTCLYYNTALVRKCLACYVATL
jgi:hypothetical protein